MSVVQLIKDLNGNHVVQRCLNHLSSGDNQFIYDAVAGHCVEVATHRHGCCVLQRCIDHASENQKVHTPHHPMPTLRLTESTFIQQQLVNEITNNGLTLVKDPYGNYVVQYVLDLNYARMTANLIAQFMGHLPELSTQKFSSNVVEKVMPRPFPHSIFHSANPVCLIFCSVWMQLMPIHEPGWSKSSQKQTNSKRWYRTHSVCVVTTIFTKRSNNN